MLNEEDIKKTENLGPSRFTFNGNIISEVGEESISNPYIAIAELIKNSYDADAKQAVLNFVNIGKHNSRIILFDDGIGMDSSQIKDRWMDIGSPHKKEITRTEENRRVPVGAKGIGRFASHCLGEQMKIITSSKNEHFGYNLFFDWKKFSSKNKATDIDIETNRFKKKISSRGTTIIIEKLKQQWNDKDKLKGLLRDLYLLTSPIDPPKNFKINENISHQYKSFKKIGKKFLDKAAYHLQIKLTGKKEVSFNFFKGDKLVKSDKKEIESSLSCGDATFDLYFYYKSTLTWKRWIKKDITKKELDEISLMLEEYGGIKMYRDHFRVKPYGDKDADWIGLDKWSRDNSMVPGNTQAFGVVTIGKETNPEIQDTTTREGVMNSVAFFDLIKFITTSIRIFVDLRSDEESDKAKAKKSKKGKKKKKEKIKVESPKVEERPTSQGPPFIEVNSNFPSTHYNQLVFEANECESKNYPNAVFLISRKIVENLVFHILEKKYRGQIDLWYDTPNHRNHSFSKLIKNLYSKKGDFSPPSNEYIEQFNIDVGKFRRAANSAIHKNQVYFADKDELKQYKINKIIQLLLDIYNRL